MDAACTIQDSIHVFSLVHKYVSRILGTYHFNMGFFVMLILRMLYKKLTTYRYSIDIVQAMP